MLLVERTADMDALDASELPHIVLLDLSTLSNTVFKPFIERCDSLKLPVIALVSPDMLLGLRPSAWRERLRGQPA